MEAPKPRLTRNAIRTAFIDHVQTHYEDRDGKIVCKICRSEIEQDICHASLHLALFGDECAGTGEVMQVPLPYCPRCEGKPKITTTCVHV